MLSLTTFLSKKKIIVDIAEWEEKLKLERDRFERAMASAKEGT